MEYQGAADAFVMSDFFYREGLNGTQIAKHTYMGRYLCFSALVHETKTWKKLELNEKFHRVKPDQLTKIADKLSVKFTNVHSTLCDIVKALLKQKNPAVKARVMLWLRKSVSLNLELQKTMT